MLRLYSRIAAALLLLSHYVHSPLARAEEHKYDVVVYGATAGGAIAAIAAADEGLKVALVEPGQHVGGMVSGGLGRTDHGNPHVIGGYSRAYFERIGKHYGEDLSWFFEPHVAEKTFRDWLAESNVTVYFGKRVDTVQKSGRTVSSITMLDGTVFKARLFMDASYEGDILPRAGITYTWGRESSSEYGESLAGRIAFSDKHQFSKPISPYDENGNLLPLIYAGDPGKVGEGDRKVQAYNFRVCMCKRKENQVPFPKPKDYDPKRYALLARYLNEAPGLKFNDVCIISMMPNDKTDVNNRGAVSTDHIGGSWEYPEADYAKREAIWQDHVSYVQGFFYFLANDPQVPKALQDEVNEWGLAKDEFADTGHWPHQLYVREARRMIGAYVMRQQDLQDNRTKPDSIGMGSYNSDSHHVQRIPNTEGSGWPSDVPGTLNEGDMQVPVQPYEIAYGTIVPKQRECENLFVVACVSASHVAYSSIRMEPQYMIMGHAAGVAASLALKTGVSVQAVPIDALQKRLREQKQILSLDDVTTWVAHPKDMPGIVVDNGLAETVGNWRRSSSVEKFVLMDYLHQAEGAPETDVVRFRPDPGLPRAGKYEVRVSYSADPNRATNAPVTVMTANGPVKLKLNQRKKPSIDGLFEPLGTFELPVGKAAIVEIGVAGADGFVVADAVQWLEVGK